LAILIPVAAQQSGLAFTLAEVLGTARLAAKVLPDTTVTLVIAAARLAADVADAGVGVGLTRPCGSQAPGPVLATQWRSGP
jgi:hypothetical protein